MEVTPALSNCKRCRKIFTSTQNDIYCPACKELEKKTFELVKEYLYSNPNSGAYQVAKATGVPLKKILNYINEGRIGG